jgi:hypothetical protein
VAGYAVVVYSFLPLGSLVHPEMRAVFEANKLGIYAHIFGSAIALIVGPFQFSKRLRIDRTALHRWLWGVFTSILWIWDDTTPNLRDGDLLIATSGSGEIGHIHYVVETAKKRGAQVALVTGDPLKKTAQIADLVFSYRPPFIWALRMLCRRSNSWAIFSSRHF